MGEHPEYFQRLAAAFVRGTLVSAPLREARSDLFVPPLDALSASEMRAVIQLGLERGLRLHRFKRTMALARVGKVLGILRGVQPTSLLDIGSGRGAFLWPLLDAFPDLPVTALDALAYRAAEIQAVHEGGVASLTAVHGDATKLNFAERGFDVVTALEVLEHIPDAERALAEICRVAGRFVVLSVPSKPDNNPEHIHLFDQRTLTALLEHQRMARVTFAYVPGHMIVVARSAGA